MRGTRGANARRLEDIENIGSKVRVFTFGDTSWDAKRAEKAIQNAERAEKVMDLEAAAKQRVTAASLLRQEEAREQQLAAAYRIYDIAASRHEMSGIYMWEAASHREEALNLAKQLGLKDREAEQREHAMNDYMASGNFGALYGGYYSATQDMLNAIWHGAALGLDEQTLKPLKEKTIEYSRHDALSDWRGNNSKSSALIRTAELAKGWGLDSTLVTELQVEAVKYATQYALEDWRSDESKSLELVTTAKLAERLNLNRLSKSIRREADSLGINAARNTRTRSAARM